MGTWRSKIKIYGIDVTDGDEDASSANLGKRLPLKRVTASKDYNFCLVIRAQEPLFHTISVCGRNGRLVKKEFTYFHFYF